jgi:hypothetical protein
MIWPMYCDAGLLAMPLLLQLPALQMTSALRLSLDWGDFVYFFWAYLWKSIEFLRVDRLFNEQGAFQVP